MASVVLAPAELPSVEAVLSNEEDSVQEARRSRSETWQFPYDVHVLFQ